MSQENSSLFKKSSVVNQEKLNKIVFIALSLGIFLVDYISVLAIWDYLHTDSHGKLSALFWLFGDAAQAYSMWLMSI